jgi:hypothetical protein
MRTKITIPMTLALCLVLNIARGQSLEAGGFFGIAHYMGDLQQADIEVLEMRKAQGIFARLNFPKFVSLNAHLYYGELSGNDAKYGTLELVRQRNLSFRSSVWELGLQAEVNYLTFGPPDRPLASPYLFGGISGFYFNPRAYYQGEWVDLQPLGTEGQNLPDAPVARYNRLQIALPVGIGLKLHPTPRLNIGFELGIRKTFTDYIDDVSGNYPDINLLKELNPMAAALSYRTPEVVGHSMPNPSGTARGNNQYWDMYFFSGITLSYVITKWNCIGGVWHKKKYFK